MSRGFLDLAELIQFAARTGDRKGMNCIARHEYGHSGYAAPWNEKGKVLVLRFEHPTEHRENGKPCKSLTQVYRTDEALWQLGLPNPDPAKLKQGRPLYRFAETIAARERGETPLLLEGERAVDAAWSIGIPATCSLGGSNASKLTDFEPLGSAVVALSGSEDEAGRKYEAENAARLHEQGADARILRLPGLRPDSGDDMVEFIANRRRDNRTDEEIRTEVTQLVEQGQTWTPSTERAPTAIPKRRESPAERLIAAARDRAGLFHDAGRRAYVTFERTGHRETWPVRASAVRAWLGSLAHVELKQIASRYLLDETCDALEAVALHESPEAEVASRIAWRDGAIVLDLADGQWRAVVVNGGGWRVVASADAPVRMVRTASMLPMPVAVGGGSLDALRALVSVASDGDWARMRGWLVGAFLPPPGTFALLALAAERGSGKSTTARRLASLVDARRAQLMSPPRDLRDLDVAAASRHVVAIDNLSSLPTTLSDRLCTILSGGGWVGRELYTDATETAHDLRAPVIVTSIGRVVVRDDLSDRALVVECPTIQSERRRTEQEMDTEWNAAQPRILGALLDAVALAMKERDAVQLDRLPRLADHAKWVEAAGPTLGAAPGSYVAAIESSQSHADAESVADDSVGTAVLMLAQRQGATPWSGTYGELNVALLGGQPAPQGWPGNARAMRSRFDRLRPALRRLGVSAVVSAETGHQNRRTWTIGRLTSDNAAGGVLASLAANGGVRGAGGANDRRAAAATTARDLLGPSETTARDLSSPFVSTAPIPGAASDASCASDVPAALPIVVEQRDGTLYVNRSEEASP